MMKGNSLIEISIKHLTRKENIVLGIILTLLITIVFVLLNISYFAMDYKNDINKYFPLSRTIVVEKNDKTEEELNSISNIDHVISNVSEIYYNPFYTSVSEWDTEEVEGTVQLRALINKTDVRVIHGRNIENVYEMLVPIKFYPHSEYNKEAENIIYKDKVLNGKDLIGQQIIIESDLGEPIEYYYENKEEYEKDYKEWENNRKKITLTIVGTFDTQDNMFERDTCYISTKAIDELKSEIAGSTASYDEDGNLSDFELEYYDGRMIMVDNYKNMSAVKTELAKQGFAYMAAFDFNDGILDLIFYLPLMVAVFIIIMVVTLIRNFIVKKFRNRHVELGILKAIGYKNNDIKKITLYENLIITLISILIAFILYLVVFYITVNVSDFIARADYYSVVVEIPYLYILVMSIFVIVYIYLINNRICHKFLNISASELLKED